MGESPAPFASTAKDLAALHSKLSIDGLLFDSSAESLATKPSNPAPPPAPVKRPKPPAVFGTSGKTSGIGALLGELDARHDHKPAGIRSIRCGGACLNEEDPRLIAP